MTFASRIICPLNYAFLSLPAEGDATLHGNDIRQIPAFIFLEGGDGTTEKTIPPSKRKLNTNLQMEEIKRSSTADATAEEVTKKEADKDDMTDEEWEEVESLERWLSRTSSDIYIYGL